MTAVTADLGRAMAGGGAIMLIRQAVGAALGLAAVVVITTLIGPAEYGRFAAVQALLLVAATIVPGGIAAALIRRPDEPSPAEWSSASAILLAAGLLAPAVLAGAAAMLGLATGIAGLPGLAVVAAAGTPFAWTAQAVIAQMERRLAYRRIAACELSGQFTFALTAALLAWIGLGAWAAAIAFALQQIVAAGVAIGIVGRLPRPRWNSTAGSAILGYAGGWAVSAGSWQLRHLVNPLIVGWAAGAAAVGQVALALRIVETLAAAKGIASRVGPAGLAKVRGDRDALGRLVGQGMEIGVLGVGLPLACVAVGLYVCHPLIPERWAGAMQVFPGIAVGAIAGGMAVLWSSVLLLEGRTGIMTLFHLAHAGLLALTTVCLMPHLGLSGYAVAEAVVVAAFAITWWANATYVAPPPLATAGLNAVCFSLAVCWPWFGAPVLLLAVVPFLLPSTWRLVQRGVTAWRSGTVGSIPVRPSP